MSADGRPPPGSGDTLAGLVDALGRWTHRVFPDPDRGDRMVAALRAAFGHDRSTVTAAGVAGVEAVARRFCRHLDLFHHADGGLPVDTDPPGWPPPDEDAVRTTGGGVSAVRRDRDGIGTLVLDELPAAHFARPFLDAAFALLAHSRGLVIDLRANGGGDPATVGLVLDWLLAPEPVHFADVVRRDRVRQWWTTGAPAVSAAAGLPVAVLVGAGTFSSAEGLAYFLQSTGRATVVGAVTRGAADHITPLVLTPHVRGHLADAFYRDPRTGSNWEGTGVRPDIVCAEQDAPARARESLLDGRRPGSGLHGAADADALSVQPDDAVAPSSPGAEETR